ncbi:CBN-LAT-2 protein [Aphelenchoides bicaudatus]|nr:CBN-LAT-2 protein [Aphelenchoides bicaudatus]
MLKAFNLVLVFCALILIAISEVDAENECREFEWNGQKVPKTAECETAQINCPDDLEGLASFTCQCKSIEWTDEPDLSECMSKSIAPLKDLVSTNQDPLNVMRRFNEEIKKLVDSGDLKGGDIVVFVDSAEDLLPKAHQRLLEPKRTSEWREQFGRKVSKEIGETGDQLLNENSQPAWMELKDEQRIDKAARLMTLLQNMLIVLGLGKEAGQNASVHFQNYEGYIQLAAPVPQNAPMMISKFVRTESFAPVEPAPSEKIEFQTGNKMQLPGIDTLSNLAPRINPSMFMTSRVAIGHQTSNDESSFDSEQPVKIGYFTFAKLGQLMTNSTSKARLNSDVVGAFVNDAVLSVNLSAAQPANFTFKHLMTDGVANPRCVYWEVLENRWATDGCRLISTNKTQTQCSCNHLTCFAILMDFTDSLTVYGGQNGKSKRWQANILDALTTIGCTVSIICLFLCLLVFTLFKSLYNTRVTIHRNLCFCLLIAELLFLFGIDYTQNVSACRGIAVGLHYFFTCSFAWMFLEGYQLYLMLIKVFEANRTRLMYYYIVGYVLPALTVAVAFMMAPENYGTPNYCWIDVKTNTLWAFVGPVSAILIFNTATLFVALHTVLSVQNRDRSLADRVLGWLKGSAMLLCLLGTTWVFGFLNAIDLMSPFSAFAFYDFELLTGLLPSISNLTLFLHFGLFIFVLHVLLNEKTRETVVRCFRRGLCCNTQLSDSSHQSSSYQNHRSANFFSLNKNRFLQWLPLRSKSSTSDTSQSSQKQANNLGVQFNKTTLPFVDEEKEVDEETTKKRLLTPLASGKHVIIERF